MGLFLFDADRRRARVMRQEILAETAWSGLRLAGARIPFPGVIRMVPGPEGLRLLHRRGRCIGAIGALLHSGGWPQAAKRLLTA